MLKFSWFSPTRRRQVCAVLASAGLLGVGGIAMASSASAAATVNIVVENVSTIDVEVRNTDTANHEYDVVVKGVDVAFEATDSAPLSGWGGFLHFEFTVCENGTYNVAVTGDDGTDFSQNVEITTARGCPSTNSPPNVTDESSTTTSGVEDCKFLLANDTDPDGDTLTVVDFQFEGIGNGQVSRNPDTEEFCYTSTPDFVGTVVVKYVVSDGEGGTGEGRWTITVNAPAPATKVVQAQLLRTSCPRGRVPAALGFYLTGVDSSNRPSSVEATLKSGAVHSVPFVGSRNGYNFYAKLGLPRGAVLTKATAVVPTDWSATFRGGMICRRG